MALNIYYKLPFAGLKRVNSDSTDIKSVYKIIRDREVREISLHLRHLITLIVVILIYELFSIEF